MKFTREQVEYLLAFFSRHCILLVNTEDIGDVNLKACTTNEAWIYDMLIGGDKE